ncbi:MAG: PEGA domain-containing protein [Myxococcaceae bacterium]
MNHAARASMALLFLLSATAFAQAPKVAILEVTSVDPDISDATAAKLAAALKAQLNDLGAGISDAELQRFRKGEPKPANLSAAESQLAAARQMMLNFQFKQALTQLRTARQTIEPEIPALRDYAPLVDILLQTAIAAQYAGDKKAAGVVFAELARLRPDIRIDPRQYPPEMIAEFDKVRLAQSNIARGRFLITSTPAGAKVFVDELEVGVTPATVALFPGDHILRVASDGYYDSVERLKIVSYQKAEKNVELKQNEALASVSVLESAVRKGAPPGELAAHAGKIAAALEATDVVVGVVAMNKEGAVLSLARFSPTGAGAGVVAPFDAKAADLTGFAATAMKALLGESPKPMEPNAPLQSKIVGEKPKRLLDFERHLLGISPGPYTEVVAQALPDPRFANPIVEKPAEPSRWYLWAGAAVIAAAAGGGAYYYATQPPPPPNFVIERR